MHIYNSGWVAPSIADLIEKLPCQSLVYHIGHLTEDCEGVVTDCSPAAKYLREIRSVVHRSYKVGGNNLLQEVDAYWHNLKTNILSTRPMYIYYSVPKGKNLHRWTPETLT